MRSGKYVVGFARSLSLSISLFLSLSLFLSVQYVTYGDCTYIVKNTAVPVVPGKKRRVWNINFNGWLLSRAPRAVWVLVLRSCCTIRPRYRTFRTAKSTLLRDPSICTVYSARENITGDVRAETRVWYEKNYFKDFSQRREEAIAYSRRIIWT